MTLKQLLIGLAATFALPWLILIVLPYGSLAGIKPVAYGEDEETKGWFPPALASSEGRGQSLYISEGCIQCHTQDIRPKYVGGDGDEFKKGWGRDQTSAAPVRTRYTMPHDYLGEPFAVIGTRRHGPDLANAGYRFQSRQEVIEHLFNPRKKKKWSTCPSYHHLFEVRRILGELSENSIKLPDRREAVATDNALSLADYIMGLKRDHPLPVELGGAPPKPAAAAPAGAAPPGTAPAPAGAAPAPTPATGQAPPPAAPVQPPPATPK